MVQKPIRYYIEKNDDQPIIRGVPVIVAGEQNVLAQPMATTSSDTPAVEMEAESDRIMRMAPLGGVARAMRSAIRRNHRGC
jgi:hypothetical protein